MFPKVHRFLRLKVLFSAGFPTDQRNGDKEFVIRRAATNRVLNVLRHWVSKHSPVNRPFSHTLELYYFNTIHIQIFR